MRKLLSLVSVGIFLCLGSNVYATSFTLEEIHQPLLQLLDKKYEAALDLANIDKNFLADIDTKYAYLRADIDSLLLQLVSNGNTVRQAVPKLAPYIRDFYGLLDLISVGGDERKLSEKNAQKVEQETLKYQKHISEVLRKHLVLPKQDFRETQTFRFHITSAYADVTIESPEIVSTVLIDQNKTENKLTFSFSASIYPYHESSDPLKISGKTTFTFKTDGADMYFFWDHLELSATGNQVMLAEYKNIEAEIMKYYKKLNQKYLFVSGETGSQLDEIFSIASMYSIIGILETEPLLTTYKNTGNTHSLHFKPETLAKILQAAGGKPTRNEIRGIQQEFRQLGITLTTTDASNSFFKLPINEYSAVGSFRLTRAGSKFSLLGDLKGKNYSEGSVFYLLLKSGYLSSYIRDNNEEIYRVLWENNQLLIDIGNGSFRVMGKHSHTVSNLNLYFGESQIGNITFLRGVQSSDFNAWFDLSSIIVDGPSGGLDFTSSWREGRFQITIPSGDMWTIDDIVESVW